MSFCFSPITICPLRINVSVPVTHLPKRLPRGNLITGRSAKETTGIISPWWDTVLTLRRSPTHSAAAYRAILQLCWARPLFRAPTQKKKCSFSFSFFLSHFLLYTGKKLSLLSLRLFLILSLNYGFFPIGHAVGDQPPSLITLAFLYPNSKRCSLLSAFSLHFPPPSSCWYHSKPALFSF